MPLTFPYLTDLAAYAGDLEDIGFTGTAAGLTPAQTGAVALLLEWLHTGWAVRFHHGCCIGADESAAVLAGLAGYVRHGHPGRPAGDPGRTTMDVSEVEHPLKQGPNPELSRNRVLAHQRVLVAAPRQEKMLLRSGTWATVRYAHLALTPVLLALPDGRIARSRAQWNPTMTSVRGIEFAEILRTP